VEFRINALNFRLLWQSIETQNLINVHRERRGELTHEYLSGPFISESSQGSRAGSVLWNRREAKSRTLCHRISSDLG
jgi:hypothetical protein